jgi:hypothetical protein
MTLDELQAKRNEILQSVEVSRAQSGQNSVELRKAEESLAVIDREIARKSGVRPSMSTLAQFSKG